MIENEFGADCSTVGVSRVEKSLGSSTAVISEVSLGVSAGGRGEQLELVPTAEVNEQVCARLATVRFYGAVPLAEFVRRFGLAGEDAERKLKRWIEKGRKVSPHDLPPYHRPAELAGWWRRMQAAGVIGKRAPEWMVLLEQTGGTVPAAAAAAAAADGAVAQPAAAEAPPGVPESLPPDFILPDLDPNAGNAEKQLWSFAKGFLDEMDAAQKAKNTARWFTAYNEYQKLLKEIRAWQKSRQKERLQLGEVLEAKKEMEVLQVVFGAMAKTFTSSLIAIARRMNPELDELGARDLVLPFRDKIFAGMKEHRFLLALPTDVITALAA